MALNYSRQLNGLQFVPQNTIPPTEPGEVRYNSSTNKLELFDGSVNPVVTETGTATLTNKTITGNIAATLVNAAGVLVINTTGTITVPDATDTLVGRDTVDTLINKSIDASTNTITGLTTANFAPVADQTIISNISGAPAAPTANTLTAIFDDILSSVQGDIIYRNAASWVTLPPGTSGQVLSTGGPAANPSWVNPTAGTGTVTQVDTGTGLTGGPITTTGTVSLANIANNTVLANTSGGAAAPVATTASTLLDSTISGTQGSVIYRNATDWVSLPPGTSGEFLKTQGAAANPLWATPAASSPAYNVVFKTANYTATPSDNVIICSGAAFTVTLYATVGNPGKIIEVIKSDASLANIITIAPGAGNFGFDGIYPTIKLTTIGQKAQFVSDGAGKWWQIVKQIPRQEAFYNPALVGFGTPTLSLFSSYREGADIVIYGYFTSGTSTAVLGKFLPGFDGIAGNITPDSVLFPPVSNINIAPRPVVGAWYNDNVAGSNYGGPLWIQNAASYAGYIHFGLGTKSNTNATSIASSGVYVSVYARFPVDGWRDGS